MAVDDESAACRKVPRSEAAPHGREGPATFVDEGPANTVAGFASVAQAKGALGGQTVRSATMAPFALGETDCLVYLPLSKRSFVLPRRAVWVLSHLTEFRTLAKHVDDLVRRAAITTEDAAWLDRQSADLVAAGVLLTRDGLLADRRRTRFTVSENPRIESLCIPTRDRPSELVRAVGSCVRNLEAWRRRCQVVIFADCTSGALERDCRTSVPERRQTGPEQPVLFAGERERLRFAESLTREGLPKDVVQFGLFGLGPRYPRVGANRNAILLHTLGQMFFSIDDDAVCDPAFSESTRTGDMALRGEEDPPEFWFCTDREQAVSSVRHCDLDVLGSHEALLGRSVGDILAGTAGDALRIGEMCPHFVEALANGSGSVGATFSGLYGDIGVVSADKALTIRNGGTRERLRASEEAFALALSSREVVRQAAAKTITHGGTFMGTFFGLDNRSLLPPFFPLSINEDGLFGYCVQSCRDGFFYGHLPFSLLHAPGGQRSYCRSATRIWLCDVVLCCLSAVPINLPKRTPELRLRRLGELLIDFGMCPLPDFREFLSCSVWDRAARAAAGMESAVKRDSAAPDYWTGELRARIAEIRSAITRPDYLIPADLVSKGNVDEALAECQDIIRRFGELLHCWPDVVEAAKLLATRGIRFAQADLNAYERTA